MLENKTEIRVRYADTDQMQFVYNGKYLEYFEVGRTEMLRSIGFPYKILEDMNYQLPLLESFVKYISPARYDDLLIIEAFVNEMPSFKIHINYKITIKGKNILAAEGYTLHVFIKKDSKKAVRLPEIFIEKLNPFYK
ncbi:MAG: thioesterase family protein [Ignavibacteriaceae bacterium]